MPEQDDVVIVGGGPAGSATALRLAQAGHRVRLLERVAFPRHKACAEYLSPATLRALHAVGVTDLPGIGDAAISATTVFAAKGSHLTGCFGSPLAGHGVGIRRSVLDAALLDAAVRAGVTVEIAKVYELMRDVHGVTGVIVQGEDGTRTERRARVVVGADGLRSIVARRTALHVQGALKRLAFSAHLEGVAGMTSVTEMHVGRQGYVGLNTLGGGVTNVSLVVPAQTAHAARGDATKFFWRTLEAIPALRARIAPATIAREVLVTGPFHAGCRHSTGDGVLLVGDAAGFFDPFTGDGIHTALVGGELASATLHHALQHANPIREHHLRDYRSARRKAFLGKWVIERLIGYGMLAPGLFDAAVARLHRQGGADLLIGATGHEISPWRVLNPVFFARMIG